MSAPSLLARLKTAARRLERDVDALVLAYRDPRVPRAARLVIGLTVAYALSPVDLVPDVIPVLGVLDDLLVVPFGLWLALRLVPAGVIADARQRAAEAPGETLSLRQTGFRIVLGVWVGMVALAWFAFA